MNHDKLSHLTKQLHSLCESVNDKTAMADCTLFQARLGMPSAWVTMIGETSTGKSTLINSFLQQPLLPVGPQPISGTVVQLICTQHVEQDTFLAIYKEACQETLDRQRFQQLAVKPEPGLARLQVRTSIKGEAWDDMQIFDTPGFNSMKVEHSEILTNFIPSSDVLIMVVGYPSGFGQVDYELYDSVSMAFHMSEQKPPLVLVINRVPARIAASDRRIAEIVSRGRDSLRSEFEVIQVAASQPDDSGIKPLPDTGHMWEYVHKLSLSPTAKRQFFINCKDYLLRIAHNALADPQTKLSGMLAKKAHAEAAKEAMRENLAELETLSRQAEHMINECFNRLKGQVPLMVRGELNALETKINQEVGQAGKWEDAGSCLTYINQHMLVFGLDNASANINQQIMGELEKLNRQLQEAMSIALRNIEKRENFGHVEISNMNERLVASIVQKLAAQSAGSLLKGLGGVGGTAAGLGNLVKMLTKKVGLLFGKTFSRDVYTQIGKIFTKRLAQGLTVAFAVIMEGLLFVWEANTWKGKLLKQCAGYLQEAEGTITRAWIDDYLAVMQQANLENVPEILGGEIAGLRQALSEEAITPGALTRQQDIVCQFEQLIYSIKEVSYD